MNKLKRKNFDDYINAKKRNKEELHLPKMLYSNFFINHPNLSIDNSEIREKVNNNISGEIIDYQVPYSNTRYEKDSIKEAIDKNKKEEKAQTHVGKSLKLFDDILNCVDNLDIEDKENDLKTENKNENKLFNIEENNLDKSGVDEDKNILITVNKSVNTSYSNLKAPKSEEKKNKQEKETYAINITDGTIIKEDKNYKQGKVTLATNLTDDSIVQKVLEERRNYKQLLKLNEYGKFKYSKDGVNYPDKIPENTLPNYKGDDNKENEYFNYLKKASNPKKIYNDIGTFSEKFNYELARISRSYGKIEAKGRFLSNPLLNKYQSSIPYYDIYKDIKFVENRYLEKGRYKYKLLPLVNAKMRNFDRLGQKIYQLNLQKRNDEFILSNIGLDKTNFASGK